MNLTDYSNIIEDRFTVMPAFDFPEHILIAIKTRIRKLQNNIIADRTDMFYISRTRKLVIVINSYDGKLSIEFSLKFIFLPCIDL